MRPELGLRPRWGRKVLEVRPPVDANKGTAVRAAARASAACAAASTRATTRPTSTRSAALDGLELAVRVAVVSDEGPSELGSAADIVVGGTDELVDLLRRASRLMHLTEEVLAPIRARYGEPHVLDWEGEISEPRVRDRDLRPVADARRDLFILNGERLALIRKPQFPPDIWRPPGGGVKPGEDFARGRASGGVRGDRTAHRARALPRRDPGAVRLPRPPALDWRTHVFLATTADEELEPRDTEEIAAARWGTLEELAGPLRERLLATGRAFWRYRVALHDAALAALRG